MVISLIYGGNAASAIVVMVFPLQVSGILHAEIYGSLRPITVRVPSILS